MFSSQFENDGSIYTIHSENKTNKFVNPACTCIIMYDNKDENKSEDVCVLSNNDLQENSKIDIHNPFQIKQTKYDSKYKLFLTNLLLKTAITPITITIFYYDEDEFVLLECFIAFLNYYYKSELQISKKEYIKITQKENLIFKHTF